MPFYQDVATILFFFGLEVAFASSLFGCYVAHKSRREVLIDHWRHLTIVLLVPLLLGLLVALSAWFFTSIFHPYISFAQEAVPFILTQELEITLVQAEFFGIVLTTFLTTLAIIHLRFRRAKTWFKYELFYGANIVLILATFLLPLIILRDSLGLYLSVEAIAQSLTVGVLFVASFLYLRARTLDWHERALIRRSRPIFVFMVLGVCLSFVSRIGMHAFDQPLTDAFLFVQTLSGVALLSLAALSGIWHLGVMSHDSKKPISLPVMLGVMAFGTITAVTWLHMSVFNGLEDTSVRIDQMYTNYVSITIGALLLALVFEWIFYKRGHVL